ncbi:Uncharacterised protein [Mycolicibacterium phlei]|nr:Uncharacterised protein [Mycolicibacterium phlei]
MAPWSQSPAGAQPGIWGRRPRCAKSAPMPRQRIGGQRLCAMVYRDTNPGAAVMSALLPNSNGYNRSLPRKRSGGGLSTRLPTNDPTNPSIATMNDTFRASAPDASTGPKLRLRSLPKESSPTSRLPSRWGGQRKPLKPSGSAVNSSWRFNVAITPTGTVAAGAAINRAPPMDLRNSTVTFSSPDPPATGSPEPKACSRSGKATACRGLKPFSLGTTPRCVERTEGQP